MKKVLLTIFFALILSIWWIAEPFRYVPFYSPKLPPVQSTLEYKCEDYSMDGKVVIKAPMDRAVREAVSTKQVLGVSLGVSKLGCGRYLAGAGYIAKAGLKPAGLDMISRVASITKPMTAVAVMQLYEQAKVDLDAPIQTYLPSFPRHSKKAVTLRQLLSHTSGMPHYKSKWDGISLTHYGSSSAAVESIFEREFSAEPGEKFIYSSFGYSVLGAVIERVSGLGYEDYMRKNIWSKAGMAHTSLEGPDAFQLQNKSKLYLKVAGHFIRSPISDLSIIYPAGGVQSTAEDLLKFGEAILKNTLIQKETLDLMIDVKGSLAPKAGDDPYGLGWVVYNKPDKGLTIAHSGAQPGVSSYLQINLDKKIVAVTLSNAFGTKNSTRKLTRTMSEFVR